MGWYASVDDILNQEELVEDYLRPWVAAIELERDLVGAHAVWWAVENMVAGRELETRHHVRATYEAIVLEPEQQLQGIFSWLGVDGTAVPQELIERASSTSHTDTQHRSPENWLNGWQQELAASEQERILGWANRLGVPWYSHERIN
jgi:hypothetical protein